MGVGVEIGSGKTTVALIDRHGRVRQRSQAKTLRGRPAMATLEPALRAIETQLSCARMEGLAVCGIGVSVPGALESSTRRPQQISLLPSLNDFPLFELLEKRYRLPVQIHADVDAAVLGEYRFGAGQGAQRLLYLTLNAVIGAAFIVDGELVSSRQQHVGHVCHLPLSPTGPRCSCGKRGCINTLLSLDAIQKMFKRALNRGEETSLLQRMLNNECFSPQLLAEEARRGDGVALQVFLEIGRWLSAAVTRYSTLYEPDVLVLGGGMQHIDPCLIALQPLEPVGAVSAGATSVLSPVRERLKVMSSHLGSDVALIGAVTPLFY
ncbi:glucokinase [Tengunoibacter tsumagoiensis]|uniref:Glucokinase n=1 Tax=Tengunoibacter tsumagoiensis TaxID=2014871 RepID=A0A401ZYI5_9CHLR|nr:glucokinase [Tengunoibacter tsumagoiensis]